MKATDIVKSWKDLSGFVYDRVSGRDKTDFSDEDWELINREGSKLVKDIGVDEISPKAKKLMELNILDKNVNFKVFEKIPAIWAAFYKNSIKIVAIENGQAIMASN